MPLAGILNFSRLVRTKKTDKNNSPGIRFRKLRLEGLEERSLLTVCTAPTQEALQTAINAATESGGDGVVEFESDMTIEITNSSDNADYENAAFALTKTLVIDGGERQIKLVAKNADVKMCYVGRDWNLDQGANVTFKNLSLEGLGGTATASTYAVKIYSAAATLENVTISRFQSVGTSGTICVTGSEAATSLVMENCTLHDNSAYGGAIASCGTLILDTSYDTISFTNNIAGFYGGAIVSTGVLTFSGTANKTTTSSNTIVNASYQGNGRNVANGNGSQTIQDSDVDWTGDADSGVHNYTYSGTAQAGSSLPIEILGFANSSRVLVDENNDGIFEEISVFSTAGLTVGANHVPIQLVDSEGNTTEVVVVIEVIDVAPTLVVTATESADGRLLKLDFVATSITVPQIWTIHWGDGTSSKSTLYANTLSAIHFYAPETSYDISLELTDLNGLEIATYFVTTRTVPPVRSKSQAATDVFPEKTAVVLAEKPVESSGDADVEVRLSSAATAIKNDVFIKPLSSDSSRSITAVANIADEVVPFFPLFDEEENDLDFITPQTVEPETDLDDARAEIITTLFDDRLEFLFLD